MKKNIIIVSVIVIAVSFWVIQKGDSNPPNNNPNVVDDCKNINMESVKKEARSIEDSMASYATSTKDIIGKSTEGGQQTNYSLGGQNKLIKQTYFSETGRSEVLYYIENSKVFYFTKKNFIYALPLSQDTSGKVKSTEFNEFFLESNQKLCNWISNGQIQSNTQAAQDTVNFLVSDLQ